VIGILVGLFTLPLLLCGLAFFRDQAFTPWVIANVALFPLLTYAAIALHEAGHALVGRGVGLQVPHVQLGIGRVLAAWRWGRTHIELHAFPLIGFTALGAAASVPWVRLRYWLATAAGPLATLALAAAAGVQLLPTPPMTTRFAPLELFGFINTFLLVVNLVPVSPLRPTRASSNDGGQLLTLPFVSEAGLVLVREVASLVEVADAIERDDLVHARRVVEAALAERPGSWSLRNALGLLLLAEQRFAEARTTFRDLVDEEPPLPHHRLIARSNVAWADFCLGDVTLRDEADLHSASVRGQLAGVSFALGTRGAVLGWLGRHDEALPLLARAYLLNGIRSSRARYAACAAISHAALGQVAEATMWLTRARKNHPRCALLARAEAALAAASVVRQQR
jgi:hypothetical protein